MSVKTNKAVIRDGLHALGLGDEEIEVFVELLKQPSTILQLSRSTGIARTKVYRIIESLIARSLATRHADDRGVFFVITEPTNFGIGIAQREVKLQEEQQTLRRLVPILSALRGGDYDSPFSVRTYEGYAGFRQMCWHELKAKGEILSFGSGDVEDLIPNRLWSQRHRERSVEAGYRVREIINSEVDLPTFTDNQDYMQQYMCRGISIRILPLDNQTIIYNDVVAIYHWREQKKVGVEIISASYADTMRAIFEQYWKLAEPQASRESQA